VCNAASVRVEPQLSMTTLSLLLTKLRSTIAFEIFQKGTRMSSKLCSGFSLRSWLLTVIAWWPRVEIEVLRWCCLSCNLFSPYRRPYWNTCKLTIDSRIMDNMGIVSKLLLICYKLDGWRKCFRYHTRILRASFLMGTVCKLVRDWSGLRVSSKKYYLVILIDKQDE